MQRFLSQKQVAYMLGVSVRTLEGHRLVGIGPQFVRIGRLVRYREADVDEWASSLRRASISTDDAHSGARGKECATAACPGAPLADRP